MKISRETLLACALIVVVGLAAGAALGWATRGSGRTVSAVHVAPGRVPVRRTAAPRVAAASVPAPATRTPTAAPSPMKPTEAPATVPPATAQPATAPPATAPPPVRTAQPANAAVAAAGSPQAGTWQIDESNVQVGTIVWTGRAGWSSGSFVLDLHKERVGGHSAVPCERETTLHVAVAPAAGASAPFRERNCSGVTSSGEVRTAQFSADGTSFSGSFWEDGAKLGDFRAQRL